MLRHSASFLPAQRVLVLFLATLFASLAGWASLAQIDIVVTARGKLQPSTFVRVAQPTEDGVVRSVAIKDGETVVASAGLVEMGPVYAHKAFSLQA